MNVPFAPSLLWPIPVLLGGLALWLYMRARFAQWQRATGEPGELLGLTVDASRSSDSQPGTVDLSPGETKTPGRALIRTGCGVIAAAVLLVILIVVGGMFMEGGSETGVGLFFVLYGAFLLALVGGAVVVLGVIVRRLRTSTVGTVASRLTMGALAGVSALSAASLLFFSVPPITGRITVMGAGGNSTAGASVKRIVFGRPLVGWPFGAGGAPVSGAEVTAVADGRGEFRVPGWIALLPTGYATVTGVGIVALSEGNVAAVTCIRTSADRFDQNADRACTNLPYTAGGRLAEEHHWRPGHIDLALHVSRAAVPDAGEEHLRLLAELTSSRFIGPGEFRAEFERYLRLYEPTEGMAADAESVASLWDSPVNPRPYPVEAARILRLVAPYRDSVLDAESLVRSETRRGLLDERLVKAAGAAGAAASPRPPVELADLLRKLGRPPYTPQWRPFCGLEARGSEDRLIAFGQAMWMWELLMSPDCTGDTRAAVTALARDTSRALPEPEVAGPVWMRDVPMVTVQSGAFSWQETSGLLSRLRTPHVMTRAEFDPAAEAQAHPVMVISTGGFQMRQAGDPKWWDAYAARLRHFVEAGGTLLVFAQAVGADYAMVPARRGSLLAKGYREWPFQGAGTVRCAAAHPLCRWFDPTQPLTMKAKGVLERWPDDAIVLLSDASTGSPLAVTYALGKGSVVVTTLSEDASFFARSGCDEGRAFLAGVLRWAAHQPTALVARRAGQAGPLTFKGRLRNATHERATSVEWILLGPSGGPGAAVGSQTVNLEPGDAVDLDVSLGAAPDLLREAGLYQVLYRLSDAGRAVRLSNGRIEPVQVQPPREAALVAVVKG